MKCIILGASGSGTITLGRAISDDNRLSNMAGWKVGVLRHCFGGKWNSLSNKYSYEQRNDGLLRLDI